MQRICCSFIGLKAAFLRPFVELKDPQGLFYALKSFHKFQRQCKYICRNIVFYMVYRNRPAVLREGLKHCTPEAGNTV